MASELSQEGQTSEIKFIEGFPSSDDYDQSKVDPTKRCQYPFKHMTQANVVHQAHQLWKDHDLGKRCGMSVRTYIKGCLLSWWREEMPTAPLEGTDFLDEADIAFLREEDKSPLKTGSSWHVFFAALACASAATVQGMDQTIINGAQVYYFYQFGITKALMKGAINGSPYIVSALTGPLLNTLLNKFLGRRWTIFVCSTVCLLTAIWQALATHVWSFIAARMALGLAVSPMSATVPMYNAEVSPAKARGRLGMLWQTFTAFGIMLGLATSVALYSAVFPSSAIFGGDNQWRLMFGLTGVPPIVVNFMMPFCIESPRWFIDEERFGDALWSFHKLRMNEIAASRDFFSAYKSWEAEKAATPGLSRLQVLWQTIGERRTKLSVLSAYYVMLMQQFCGINAIAYYSTNMFMDIGYERQRALYFSMGFGAINFVFAAIAFMCIDKAGRRRLMLCTLPCMAIALACVAGLSGLGGTGGMAGTTTGMYIFTAFYSVGPGPVSFGYAAEVFPLQTKPLLMASATSLTWMFNFLVSFSWPAISEAFGVSGAFALYTCFNVIGAIIAFFFMRETKQKTLEEMDLMFSVSAGDFAKDRGLYLWDKVTRSKKERADIFEAAREQAREAQVKPEATTSSAEVKVWHHESQC